MKAICIDNTDSLVLKKGEIYYLFEHNTTHVYASRFPVEGSHCGCFQKCRFQLLEKTDPSPELIRKGEPPENEWEQLDIFYVLNNI